MLLLSVYATKDGGVMVTSNLGKTAEQTYMFIITQGNTNNKYIRLRCAWDYQHYYHSHHQSQVYENCLAFIQCGKFVPLAEERQENNHALQQRARAGSLSEILVARGQIVGTC